MKKKSVLKAVIAAALLTVMVPAVLTGCGSGGDTSAVTSEIEVEVVDRSAWNMILVNYAHELDPDYEVELVAIPSGQYVDARIYDDLMQMLNDCAATGANPGISTAYRGISYQQILYDQEVQEWIDDGYSEEAALIMAKTEVAKPGTSEHHTGLAVDIIADGVMELEQEFEDTDVGKWMAENSYKYGFILRYPENKKHITGVIYEPWHFRYVGKEVAQYLYDTGLCFEEYLGIIDTPDYLTYEMSELDSDEEQIID